MFIPSRTKARTEGRMASARIDRPRATPSPPPSFAEYNRVALTSPVNREGVALSAGAEGVIVHDHADGSYSVEFEKPTFEVVTIFATELKAVG
jgi:Domain of unknown function (DUF4926)